MGLDNIPKIYPCRKAGTQVETDDGKLDCDATIAAGGCPWAVEFSGASGAVWGAFGTYCWFRGSWGNLLLDELGVDDAVGFYADHCDGETKTPEDCRRVADLLESAFVAAGRQLFHDGVDVSADVEYAIRWLRWVADNADGATAW